MTPVLVAVTDHHVVLLECSWLNHNRPKSVHMRFPRRIQLGPVDTSTDGPVFRVGNFNFETDDEYVSVIMAADAEISGEGYLPPDPLPDL